jgi:hypothetical protein
MATPEAVFDWSFKIVQEKLCSAVVGLSAESNGLHFTIAKATSQYLEGSFMQTAASTSQCNSNAITLSLQLIDSVLLLKPTRCDPKCFINLFSQFLKGQDPNLERGHFPAA